MLSTVRSADRIAVIDNGVIVEVGAHKDLIADESTHYSRLVRLQRNTSVLDTDHPPVPQSESISHRPSSADRSSSGHRLSLSKSTPTSFSGNSPPSTISNHAPSLYRLLTLNLPEWRQGLIGGFSAIASGSIQPVYAFTIGGMIAAFFLPDHDALKSAIRRYALIFSSLSVVSIAANLAQHYNFAVMGENLTRRIRLRVFGKILSFEPAYFDEVANSSGAICARLENEAVLVKTLVADRFSLMIQTAAAVAIAMAMGLAVAWKLAAVMIAVQPLSILFYYAKKIVLSRLTVEVARAEGCSTQIAVEAVYNHRIVASFGCADKLLGIFEKAQEEPMKTARKRAWTAGMAMGCSPCLSFLSWALDFWYGGKLVESGEISAGDVFKTFFILVSTGKVIADAGSMTSDLVKGAAALASTFGILDRDSHIPCNSSVEGNTSSLKKIEGRIDLKKVDFIYPSRPQCLVLRDFNLEIKAGSSVGLVGRSGCGKSTVIGLIQRFYDVERGVVLIDGMDIRELDVKWYRSFTALVSQEPVIFSGSIRENISFGKPEAGEDEILDAARAANAHDFISGLKEGYETDCGERGLQLSGGQKQRIAVARAILRNPSILLLDEATSALDAQSERVVQEAFQRIMVGRTAVVVAHRLNTVKSLGTIAFLADGKVIEQGSYATLTTKRGAFFNLAKLQS